MKVNFTKEELFNVFWDNSFYGNTEFAIFGNKEKDLKVIVIAEEHEDMSDYAEEMAEFIQNGYKKVFSGDIEDFICKDRADEKGAEEIKNETFSDTEIEFED